MNAGRSRASMRSRGTSTSMCVVTPERVLAALSRHIGAQRGVRADVLVAEISGTPATTYGTRALRTVITTLRMDGHHVCGTPETGYFIAETADELNTTCAFLYDRALTTLTQIARMKKIALPDLRGQLHLPT